MESTENEEGGPLSSQTHVQSDDKMHALIVQFRATGC
jgi:hypothetical protein